MKKKNRLWYLMGLALALFIMTMVPGRTVSASDEIPQPVVSPNHCKVGMGNYGRITVPLKAKGDRISNIKTYSGTKGSTETKNLVVKLFNVTYYGKDNNAELIYYAKKAGTYRIKYTIVSKSGKKRGNETVKVSASSTEPTAIGMSLDGKRLNVPSSEEGKGYIFSEKKSATVKFFAAPGCKIKKIEIAYWDANNKVVRKKISNGSKITFSTKSAEYEYPVGAQYDIFAPNLFIVYYTDSYSLNKSEVYNSQFYLRVPANSSVKGGTTFL